MKIPGKRPTRYAIWMTLLATVFLLAGCGRATLFSDLDERQANDVMAALLASGVKADKRTSISKSGWEIRIDQSDFPYAMQVLNSRGLPRQKYVSMCEMFKREGFASSATEERARFQCSLEQELAHTLSSYPGVVEARVHIAMPERDPLGGDTGNSSASVTIFEQPGANMRTEESRLKLMVKDAVPGLIDLNRVTMRFATVPGPGESRGAESGPTPVAMSAISPLVIFAVAAVVGLLALGLAFGGRVRQRLQGKSKQDERIWNG